MFGDKVARTWMKGSCEEGAHDQIPQGVGACVLHQKIVKSHLGDDVEDVYSSHGEVVDHHGTDCIENYLERGEKGLSKNGIKEKCFESGWKIRIEPVYSERLMMRQMVRSKSSAVGQADRKVCKDG